MRRRTDNNLGVALRANTPEDLKKCFDAYFEKCEKENIPLSISGLARSVGFISRSTFLNYSKREEFIPVIEAAKFRVEEFYEVSLHKKSGHAGVIFALKNMGWTDQIETRHTGEVNISPISWAKSKSKNEIAQPLELPSSPKEKTYGGD